MFWSHLSAIETGFTDLRVGFKIMCALVPAGINLYPYPHLLGLISVNICYPLPFLGSAAAGLGHYRRGVVAGSARVGAGNSQGAAAPTTTSLRDRERFWQRREGRAGGGGREKSERPGGVGWVS